MRVLVSAASQSGATAEIAQQIGTVLAGHGIPADVRPPDGVGDVAGYDAAVIGSAVYSGRWLPAALDLVDRFSGVWPSFPVWLFSSGPVGDPKRTLVQQPGSDPVDLPRVRALTRACEHRVFPGRLVSVENPRVTQRIASFLFRGLEGDFRDWSAVRTWADGITEALQSGSASGAGTSSREAG